MSILVMYFQLSMPKIIQDFCYSRISSERGDPLTVTLGNHLIMH
jgi:hypothetical protein